MFDLMGAANPFLFKCLRCGHTWIARRVDAQGKPVPPKSCPNPDCQSPYWRRPRMTKKDRAELTRKKTRAYWQGRKET